MQLAQPVAVLRTTSRLAALFHNVVMTVHDEAGQPFGAIRYLLLNQRSGRVDYAVLRFTTSHTVGADHYPIPWEMLAYHRGLDGYILALDPRALVDAPHYRSGQPIDDQASCTRVHAFYGLDYDQQGGRQND